MNTVLARTGLGIAVASLLFANSASAITIVGYELTDGSLSPTATDPNVIASPITVSAAAWQFINEGFQGENPGGADFYPTRQGDLNANTAALAVSLNRYFEFTVTPSVGYQMGLSSAGLSFDLTRGGASTPRGWVLRSSIDGYSGDIAGADVPTQYPSFTSYTVDLSGVEYQDIAGPVTFRLYGYVPSWDKSLDYDFIRLNGQVSLVPDGGLTAMFLGMGMLGLGWVRRMVK